MTQLICPVSGGLSSDYPAMSGVLVTNQPWSDLVGVCCQRVSDLINRKSHPQNLMVPVTDTLLYDLGPISQRFVRAMNSLDL